ncbi:MAG: efflux RND transporter periplasmic adaptor subunit [Nitrospiraceae bacterium]
MTGTPIRDADVSVLTLPRDEPPHGHRTCRTRLVWTIGVLAVCLCMILLYWYAPFLSARPEVSTAPVRTVGGQASSAPLIASGYVVAQRQASVASKGTGRLEYLGVTIGSRVRTGDVVARVQQDDIRALHQQARARLDVAKAALINAQAERRDARQNFARAEALLPNQYISQAEVDMAQNRLHRAEAAVRSSEAAITAAEADVQTADVMLENTVIRAPFDGTVLKKFAEIGEVVAPMASSAGSRGAVVLIADTASLAVETEISEALIAQISPNQQADIVLDAFPNIHYPAVVEQVVPTADRSKGTVLAKVRFNKLDDRVLPEMSAKVSFSPAGSSADPEPVRMFVPSSSLVRTNGQTVLYVLEDETAREVPVEVVAEQGSDSEIRGSLASPATVILAPPRSLTSGSRVRFHPGHQEIAPR